MSLKPCRDGLIIALLILSVPLLAGDPKSGKTREARVESTRNAPAVLWREPADISSRNLYYGPGGQQHQPHSTFTFVKEDLEGSNPKFIVKDEDGVKWTVKLGEEARPETVASRFVWAVGYFANEDYFLADIKIEGMPDHVKRGKKQIGPDGSIHDVRLKRHLTDEEKIGHWKWRDDPFVNTRELNGLKAMMAVINNWDLKDDNNEIYKRKDQPELIYMTSDLGASFGSNGHSFPHSHSKGYLDSYIHSKFITRIRPDDVDFATPSRPSIMYAGKLRSYLQRRRLTWIGKHIPRADAKWMGEMLARLSPGQIHDAFRAGGYTPEQIEAFSQVLQERIAELTEL